ncbi:MAG: hypothetical protein LQ337_002600 [Flavoplaca oasis]|nr:MAG: hypothetical protein LQ337_002600 [Flavoplaca oasis]
MADEGFDGPYLIELAEALVDKFGVFKDREALFKHVCERYEDWLSKTSAKEQPHEEMNPEVNTEGSPMVGTTTPLAGCKRKASALDSETGNESDGSTKLFSPAQEASRRRDEARKGSSGSQKSRGFAKPTPGSGEKALKAAGGSLLKSGAIRKSLMMDKRGTCQVNFERPRLA